ncbi:MULTISPECIES: c-type cytochrome [Roseobacter]|uniref:Cytochrome c-552 n=1 Tax=Roseobacter litoralis (strain ATCC 49566 / DSM 6996 / JCM 21268 / NBRC 15278 / OCh 149) TaxID=391595 RepID=F7ZAB3_ROSLO|nr:MULTISPECIES: cytochrome c family protein [Roseobacter]AEI95460.1 cytochrome c-552 [Roseobacter litoralis Och 149]GIT88474.1 cytochrome c [Roseobacter sp. OBYS 0001]
MLDTMTFTKAAGGICGALLVFLLGKWAAEELYHVEMHGEASYVIEVESGEDTAEVEEVDFATIMASASVEDGAKVFRKCSACHKLVQGENVAGPYLYGVVGRDKGTAEGYGYSDTLASMEGAWTPENLSGFLEKPSSYAPGTSMGFAGLRKVEDRADVIAYLDSLDD